MIAHLYYAYLIYLKWKQIFYPHTCLTFINAAATLCFYAYISNINETKEFITGANPNNKENKLKMSVVLTKNANILRKSSNNTIETKDDNTYKDYILSSNSKT